MATPQIMERGNSVASSGAGATKEGTPNATVDLKRRQSSIAAASLIPSEDLDTSNVKTKPTPRKPIEPTFRGWKEVGRYEEHDALTEEDETIDLLNKGSSWDTVLPPVIYGDWYHNVGYLIVGALLSWIVGWFKFSIAPVFFIMVVFGVLYRESVKKYRGALREEVQREFSIKTIENDYETMEWCNYFVSRFWGYLEPSISQIVCDQANPIIASNPYIPAFIKAIGIDSFTLGSKPPRIERVKTMHGTADDVVVMDWGFSFTPNSLVDANSKQLKSRVNQTTVIRINLFGMLNIPITVSDISGHGLARIRLRMMTSFPHVETINVSIIEPLEFDFNTKIAGESSLWWEVLSFPGLYPFINEMVKKYVGPMLFSPLSFQLNVQQLLSGNALNSAIGIIAITADSARGLKGFSSLGNTLDPYLNLGFKTDVLAKTVVKSDTNAPVWKETFYLPVSSLSEPLHISVVDFNEFRKDREVGVILFDLEGCVDNPKQPNLTAPFLRNNKPVGELNFSIHYMPTLEPIKQADGATEPPPDLNTGIAQINIIEARQLPGGDKGASTYAELKLNNETVLTTSVQKNTNTPGWGATKEEIIFNKAKTKVRLSIKDKSNRVIGQVNTSLNSLIDATQVDQTWFPLSRKGGNGGEVRISTTWKPVAIEGASVGRGYAPPIGALRISIKDAEDLINLETIGKVDPYAKILVNGVERSRTVACDSTLHPTWNEIHYATITSPNQKLTIEVMDVEAHSPDRTLGSFDVKLNDFIHKDETGHYIEYHDSKLRSSKLLHKKGLKGYVHYSIAFYPALQVMSLQEIKEEEEEKKEEEKQKAEQEKNGSKEEKKVTTANDDDEGFGDVVESKLKLSLNELIEHTSGVFVYEILEGELTKDDVFLQAYFDNNMFNNFVSTEIKRKKAKIGLTGDVIITELEWSQATFRLVKNNRDNRASKAIAETSIPTLQLLKNAYEKPSKIRLSGPGEATFTIQCSWIPLVFESGIPPQDTKDNTGILTVEVVRAEGLPAADSNGKSDPYTELFLNTEKKSFYKTKKIKKTLDPEWNESGDVEVANRYDSDIKIVCMDWDMADKDDLLGTGYIHLKDYDTKGGSVADAEVPLFGEKGEPAGKIFVRLSFKSCFVMNVKARGTTTMGLTTVGSVGVGVGKGVGKGVGTVGKGIGSGIKGIRRRLGGSSD
ncbi:Tricalbin-1 [Spathaspora sp. JA1]|nr:Tricalbin-1 [Spathaspora sp. JA1]